MHCRTVIISLTGTPGTGKTTVGKLLEQRGMHTIELSDLIKERNLYDSFDAERNSYDVDPEVLDEAISAMKITDDCVLIGHLSHYLTCDKIIVLRCKPSILAKRLNSRGWKESKVKENIEAEALDVILIEAVETDREVSEIDTSNLSAEEVCDATIKIKAGETANYVPGNIDWSEEVLEWY